MIVLINPNSTVAMTESMLRVARQVAPGVRIEGMTNHGGPPAIQGAADGDLAVPPMLDCVKAAAAEGAQAIIIGCFDDTGLEEARALVDCPVLGIGQAAYLTAIAVGGRFSVVTTLSVSLPVLEGNVRRYGLGAYLAKMRASEVPVLALEEDPEAATQKVLAEVRRAEAEDDIRSVVLGCGGMVDIAARAGQGTQVRMIDGVRAAVAMAAAL
ncbi:aspartate/glutamate racemase family protein [Tropicibacter sp. S64]|uniref:aspartate/glutamate racemase family protein n=1 Tax=Tropicibacter sp. S64 TaxID=3415122 RepID=UPI003C7C89E6